MSLLDTQRALLARASRSPLAPGCPAPSFTPAGMPAPPPGQPQGSAGNEWLPSLLHAPVDISAAGDNTIVSAGSARIFVHAVKLWNVASQTITLSSGASGPLNKRLDRLTNFPALTGYMLGISKLAWYTLDQGDDLIINLSLAAQIDGFILYRLDT
jgi:hypothetical protein